MIEVLLPTIIGMAVDALGGSTEIKELAIENAPAVAAAVGGTSLGVGAFLEWILRIMPTKKRRGVILGLAKVLSLVETVYVWFGKVIPYIREGLEWADKKADKLVENKVKK